MSRNHAVVALELTETQLVTLGNAATEADIQPVWEFSDVQDILLLAHRVLGDHVPAIKNIIVANVDASSPGHFMVLWDGDTHWVSGGYEDLDEFQEKNHATSYYIATHVVQKLIEVRNHIIGSLASRGYRIEEEGKGE